MARTILNDLFWQGQDFSVASNIFYGHENFILHAHTYYEFFLVVEGELIHTLNGQTSALQRRSLCFLYPDDEHGLRNSAKGDKVHIVNCTFSEGFLKDTENFLRHDLGTLPENWPNGLQGINSALWLALTNKAAVLQFQNHKFSPLEQRALFRGMLGDVLLLLAKREYPVLTEIPGWLIKAREQMQLEENFLAGLKRFVRLSGRTQEHLTRSLRKYYNETPTAYINQLRVRKAAQELLYTRKDIWNIMSDCGFNNYSYFLKCFNRNFGMTPRQYIKVNRRVFTL
ncbi:MAG: helix-turn-helix domain-containing protein [Victivallaceae bacterium]|nr:helix-turn-helix domain-containing protein [Victivallaceae bacterium]